MSIYREAAASCALDGETQYVGKPICFTVYGHASPAGSKRAFIPKGWTRAIVTDACKGTKSWQQEVKSAAIQTRGVRALADLLDGPVSVTFRFYRARPKGHFGSGRNAGNVKDSAPKYPTSKPDLLKTARAIEDALTGIIWKDDSQIVDEHLEKHWGDPERVEISIVPLST